MKQLLVTGAGGNASMNFMRALRFGGWEYPIIGTDLNKWHLLVSHANERVLLDRTRDWYKQINKLIDSYKVDFLHPQTDREIDLVADRYEDYETKTRLPRPEIIKICQDKYALWEILNASGVNVPATTLFSEINFRSFSSKVWVRARRGAGSKAALPLTDWYQAREWVNYWDERSNLTDKDFTISEFLPGKEFAFQSIWHNGKLITSAVRERIEYFFGSLMPSNQSSTPSIARTVHDDRVNLVATKAITAVDDCPHGIYCVDIKESSSGVPCVTEINAGRFYTTSDFITEAGCNMPLMHVKLFFNEEIPSVPKYNAVPPNLYWVRGLDKSPVLCHEEDLAELQSCRSSGV